MTRRYRLHICVRILSLLFILTMLLATLPMWALPPISAQDAPDLPRTHLRISGSVLQIADLLHRAQLAGAVGQRPPALNDAPIRLSAAGEIGVEVRVQPPVAQAAAAISATGIRVNTWSDDVALVGAWVYPEQLAPLAALPQVVRVEPMFAPVVRTGSVTSEGDTVMGAAAARAQSGVTGAGVRIGVISDGVEGLADSQATGDLPPDCAEPLPAEPGACVYVHPDYIGGGSEGRAMQEIIHDLAPGATLGFASGIDGVTGFVGAIDALQNDFQADIIVDDLGYYNEPFFEDGTIGTRARQAVDAGVVFVSAAGNDAESHYQAPLSPEDISTTIEESTGALHTFAPGDTGLSFELPAGGFLLVNLQWDNPFDMPVDDLDLFVTDGSLVLARSTESESIGGTASEFIWYVNRRRASHTVAVQVLADELHSELSPQIEMFFFATAAPEYNVPGDGIFGHPGIPGVIGVGAVDQATPEQIRSYSSHGPTSISHPQAETRPKPDIVGVDGVTTATPGFENFAGTSAAAPHVAALAALLLDANPNLPGADVRVLLNTSAADLLDPGYDLVSGHGRAQGDAALELLHNGFIAPISPDPRAFSVDEIRVYFGVPVEDFTLDDLQLERDGTPLSLEGATLVSDDQQTWTLGSLASLTASSGIYTLTLDSSGVNMAGSGALSGSSSAAWTVDTTLATVTITEAPADPTIARSARFSFAAPEAGVTYECRLDDSPWQACSSPRSYSNLNIGSHIFDVRALDQVGNSGVPTSYTWTIEAPPQQVHMLYVPLVAR